MALKQCCGYGPCVLTKDLKACAACSEVLYCCKEHQVEHFKHGGHKMVCPGRTKGPPLTFQECVEKAQKYHADSSWRVALPYYSAMLELTERSTGLFHPQVAKILEVMVTCYRHMERYEDAAACLQRVLVIKEMLNPKNEDVEMNRSAFMTTGLLAEVYLAGGNLDLAKELLEKTETAAKESFGEDSFERGRALCALGTCLERKGDIDEAVQALTTAIAVEKYSKPTTSQEMVAAGNGFFNLAVLLFNQDKLAEAKPLFSRTIELKTSGGLAADHADVQEAKDYLNRIAAKNG